MRTAEIGLLILGMAVVTYLPRALPAVLIERLRLGARARRFLSLLPYAAMSALIFPGVFSVDAAHPLFGLAGGGAAVLLAWRHAPLLACVLGAVGVVCLCYLTV